MQTEYEATFYPIDIVAMQLKLLAGGYTCTRPEYTQMRTTFSLPDGNTLDGAFARVRDEGGKTTMTIKQFTRDGSIHSQKECELIIDDYETGIQFLQHLGCTIKAVQENKRELWQKDDIYVMIDQRPFLQPLMEIEGSDVSSVKKAALDLGCRREEALFDSVTEIYARTYSVSHDFINNRTPQIVFDMQNPFSTIL